MSFASDLNGIMFTQEHAQLYSMSIHLTPFNNISVSVTHTLDY